MNAGPCFGHPARQSTTSAPRLDRWVMPIVAFRLGGHSDKVPTQQRSGPPVSDGGRYPDDPSHDERPAGYDSN